MNVFFWVYVLINVGELVKAEDAQQWQDFKAQFAKNYATPEEDQQKKNIYMANMEKIAKHNEMYEKGEVSFKMGINHFGDLTTEEFAKTHLANFKPTNYLTAMSESQQGDSIIITALPPNSGTVPESKNWVTEGAVTDVKDQGLVCGCCWAFCMTALIESHLFIHSKKLVSLSAQNLLDCVRDKYNGVNHSCEGGSMIYPLQYVVDNQGIDTDKSYPYTEKQGECHYNPKNKATKIKSYKRPIPGDEKLIRDIVGAIGPVSCGFCAESDFSQFYKSGIYSSKTCGKTMESMNHGIVIVGYGTEKGKDFWIIKNSWGTRWGENGYFRLLRNTNECAIAVENYFPIL